jgi:peptide/nickel transport system ATP-binding protein
MVMGTDGILRISDLRTHFLTDDGEVKAVDGINLTIRKGESMGLVGESGCGKTVTAYSTLRLVPNPPGRIVSGQIHFKGRDLLKLSEKEMRGVRGKEIAMVFQEPASSSNPSFTIGNQIQEVIRFHQGGNRVQVRKKAIEILDAVRIPDPVRILTQYPHELSGGMLQRVMIAIAISCEPDLLICDEPTTALDVSMQAQVINLLNDLRRERGTSLLFITHDLGVLSWVCTHAAVMYAGNIIEQADIRALVKNPQHPYTSALIGASPRLDRDCQVLDSIRGSVPNLTNPPGGCKFHPRCDRVLPVCTEQVPQLKEKGDGHCVACFADSEGGAA